jgi:tRNA 2-thiouridine synthesizing protein A
MADFDDELDATGLNCPLPILRAKKALNGLEAGKVLRIIATDPGSVKDFEAFAKQTGNELMSSTEEDGKFMFLMKKGGKTPVITRGFFMLGVSGCSGAFSCPGW